MDTALISLRAFLGLSGTAKQSKSGFWFAQELCDVGFEGGLWGPSRKLRAALRRDALRKRRTARLPPVYPNGWFVVLESCRLASAGAVQYVSVLGQNLAVFRGESGRAHVLDAYCPHLGANMAIGGAVRGDCLVCPFHEWRFDGRDGKCTAVPYAQKVPAFARVRRWESREINGLVFVWYHAEGEPPAWEPQPMPPLEDGSLTFGGRYEFLVACHIQDIPENAADVAHFDAVHGPAIGEAGRFFR
ncbi:hypothetical protein ONE63_011188 [Megalurothrips usitatus]|uniref:cholesterol 7-desaturase n=1 Tax=Megalurothrips usitatus TaxID=439358 RepID=A0AAV7X0P0_9NEOP|nr:hypothetical protein ONE63_011188 [Megalurothrips usitatus]